MSTNHTSNYLLSQWEASDQVQRTDFNADNLKIDAALQAQRFGRFEVLHSVTIPAGTEGVTSIDFDMTDIHPEDWYFWVLGCSDTQNVLTLVVNNLRSGEHVEVKPNPSVIKGGYASLGGARHSLVLIATCRSGTGCAPVLAYNGTITTTNIGIPCENITTLSFIPERDSTIVAPNTATFFLLGVR